MAEMTRKKAITLITPVIDGEATQQEQQAFFDYLEHDEEVRHLYQQELETKIFIRKNLPKVKAPRQLYHFASKVECHANYADYPSNQCLKDLPKDTSHRNHRIFLYASVAAAFLISFLFLFISFDLSGDAQADTVVIENQATRHFETLLTSETQVHSGSHSIESAQTIIREEMGLDIPVPELREATFIGVGNSEFINGFYTPVFSYTCPNNHPIYVFAFDMDKLANELKPDQKASETCRTESDYHISEINGHQTVSWRWGNTWYTAVSEHQGERFAEMLPR